MARCRTRKFSLCGTAALWRARGRERRCGARCHLPRGTARAAPHDRKRRARRNGSRTALFARCTKNGRWHRTPCVRGCGDVAARNLEHGRDRRLCRTHRALVQRRCGRSPRTRVCNRVGHRPNARRSRDARLAGRVDPRGSRNVRDARHAAGNRVSRARARGAPTRWRVGRLRAMVACGRRAACLSLRSHGRGRLRARGRFARTYGARSVTRRVRLRARACERRVRRNLRYRRRADRRRRVYRADTA